jgi:hypothetical protein
MNNPGGVEGSGAFAPLPGCVFLIVRAVPGCVLRTTRGYRLPSLRDEGGEGGVARVVGAWLPSLRDERGEGEGVRWVEFVGFRPSGMKEARGCVARWVEFVGFHPSGMKEAVGMSRGGRVGGNRV